MSIFKMCKDRNFVKITGSANRLITVVKVEEKYFQVLLLRMKNMLLFCKSILIGI